MKKKKITKLLVLALAGAMVFSLAACSNSADTNSPAPSGTGDGGSAAVTGDTINVGALFQHHRRPGLSGRARLSGFPALL